MPRGHPDPSIERCKARRRRTGERCQRVPMNGQLVCRTHGGGTPQAKRKAQERLEALQPRAVRVVKEALNSGDHTHALKAAVITFDRTGMSPTAKVETNVLEPWQKALGAVSQKMSKKTKKKAKAAKEKS